MLEFLGVLNPKQACQCQKTLKPKTKTLRLMAGAKLHGHPPTSAKYTDADCAAYLHFFSDLKALLASKSSVVTQCIIRAFEVLMSFGFGVLSHKNHGPLRKWRVERGAEMPTDAEAPDGKAASGGAQYDSFKVP